jgi:hypothetical protein
VSVSVQYTVSLLRTDTLHSALLSACVFLLPLNTLSLKHHFSTLSLNMHAPTPLPHLILLFFTPYSSSSPHPISFPTMPSTCRATLRWLLTRQQAGNHSGLHGWCEECWTTRCADWCTYTPTILPSYIEVR